MKKLKLPNTDSLKALSDFWDTHDLADFDNELEEVTQTVFERPAVIPLKLESSEAKAVRKIAKTRGVPAADLIRGWVQEKIQAR